MTMSPQLVNFLRAYLKWAEAGAPRALFDNPCDFHPSMGLCANSVTFSENVLERYGDRVYALEEEMKDHWRLEGRDPTYPFGEREYDRDSVDRTQHLNPHRMSWVRERLASVDVRRT